MTGKEGGATGAAVRVRLPSPLRSYAAGAAEVTVALAQPATLAAVLRALDDLCPGLRFRIIDERGGLRPHIRLFIGPALARDLLDPVTAGASVMIVAALSGG